MTSSYRI